MADFNQFGERIVKPDDPAVIKGELNKPPQRPPVKPQPPTGSSAPTLGDAIGAIAKAGAPQGLVQRKQKIDQQVDQATGTLGSNF